MPPSQTESGPEIIAGNGTIIQGNLVCTDATGRNPLGNARFGIAVYTAFNLISSNVISGSVGEAGLFAGNSVSLVHDNLIQGNFIGPDITGTNLIGNAGNGIYVSLATSNTIQSNVIAGNQNQGVYIAPGTTAEAVLGNSIFANAGLGIFLGSGANNSQTNPLLTSAATGLGNVSLGGSLKSGTNAGYRLEFFSNASCDGSGFGEGQVFLGATNLTTDANGEVPFIMILANPAGHANFTATATDTNGNTSAFSPCISVSGPCVLNCSTNIVVSTAPNQCGAIVNFIPSTSGNCGAVNCSPPSGSFFPKGTNTVTCTSANGTNCSFTITVLDTFAPNITCPANITTNVPPAQSNVVVNFSAPIFTDNCDLASTNVSPVSGSLFPLGITTVTCTATDTSGNTNICSFTVTVMHSNTPPIAQCQNVITNADGSCQANVSASVVDNGSFDPDGTITNRFLNPPGPYLKGTNTVNFTVVDDQGGSNSCLASIIVLDTTLPTVICPANIVTNAPPGQTSVVVNYPTPITTDNCPGATNNTSIPPSGSLFPLGTTVVTCSGTDASKNTNFCSFTVTVNATPIDRVWTNVLGGNYHTAANWQSNVVPTFLESARFVSNTSYQVSWTIDGTAANAFFDAGSGTVTQAIGTRFWLLTNSYVIGPNSGSTASVALVSGTLRVTNSARSGMFEVRRGTNRLNAGLMEVDRLVMTNAAGRFEFNGGTLNTRGAAITNNSSFNVGTSNGTPATWGVLSGTNVTRFQLHVGRDATNSLLIVTNGARLISFGAFIGFGSTARSNMAIISGPDSVWEGGNDFDFGGGGSFNQLIVKLGGAIIDSDAIIGNGGGTSNSILINGGGSVWSNASLSIYGSFNQLTVSAGAHLSSGLSLIDGTVASGSHNTVLIDQPGALWDAGVLSVGSSASFNQLVVSNAAKVQASELYIGFDPTSTNNRVAVNGTLQVTNPAATAPFDIRRGTNQLNSGLIEADRLLMTNTLGIFQFKGGTLNVRASTISNGQLFLVGNGASAATFNLVGNGGHSFANDLKILTNASLIGNGTIFGTLGVDPGATLSPGTSIGKFILLNSPLLQGTVVMEISKNGTTITNDQIQVNGSVTYGGALIVSDLGPDALTVGDRFVLFSAFGYSGSFSSIALPPLGPGLAWRNRLAVDGSIMVVPSAPSVPLSRGSYFQDFNTLASNGNEVHYLWENNVTLPGWYAAQATSPFVMADYIVSAGADTTGALYSFGSTDSPERALGSIGSGTPDVIGFGLSLTNDLGNALSNFVISYTGEQWRNGTTAVTNTLTFWYRTSTSPLTNPQPGVAVNWTAVTNLDFVSPTVLTNGKALDGNQATNRHTFSAINIPGLVVLPGQNLFFRWVDTNDLSFDQGMAVDDLRVSFSGVARPQITSITSNPSNQFAQIAGMGTSNAIYVIEAATNLHAPIFWQRIGSNAANAGLFQFTDTNAPLFPMRFYRALSP